MAQWVKNPPTMQKTQESWVQSLGQEDPLEEEMAAPPVFLPEESHGQKSLVGYSPKGRRVGHDQATKHIGTMMLTVMMISSKSVL